MTIEDWTRIDDYTSALLVEDDDALAAAATLATDEGLPELAVAPNQGKFLHLLARIAGARTVLEIGTFGGYSTIWLARAVGAEGRVVTIEAEERFARTAEANIARAELSHVVDQRVGSAHDELARLEGEGAGPFDLVFVDADKASVPAYVAAALRLTRPGSVLVVDNVVLQGLLVDETSPNPAVHGLRRFHEMLADEPRLSATSIQTVGGRGHDGFTLALVQ